MSTVTRRRFLSSALATACIGNLPHLVAAGEPRRLVCQSRILDVNGKPATVFGIGEDGKGQGLVLDPRERFQVALVNRLAEPTLIHWHGQMPPNVQDGVPGVTQPPLAAGGEYLYDFEPLAGSHWMHSHFGLQRQNLLSASLIVRTEEDERADAQDKVVFLHDFTFRDPEEILAELIAGGGDHAQVGTAEHGSAGVMSHSSGQGMQMQATMGAHDAHQPAQGHGSPAMGAMPGHLNDVEFDAYLANDRTLADPEVVRVERGGRIRLRFVNAAASTNFLIDLGTLGGQIVATDGNPVVPMDASGPLSLAMAQRLDVLVQLPAEEGVWPILAHREGELQRTGIILATRNAVVRKVSLTNHQMAPPADTRLEHHLRPTRQLPARAVSRQIRLRLTGSMSPYRWGIDGMQWGEHAPIRIAESARVELTFENETDMAHPMHIHGHHFKVSAINGMPVDGPIRDTVLVPAKGSIQVMFDTGSPGRWLVHCHNAYHMAPGMMTEIVI